MSIEAFNGVVVAELFVMPYKFSILEPEPVIETETLREKVLWGVNFNLSIDVMFYEFIAEGS